MLSCCLNIHVEHNFEASASMSHGLLVDVVFTVETRCSRVGLSQSRLEYLDEIIVFGVNAGLTTFVVPYHEVF